LATLAVTIALAAGCASTLDKAGEAEAIGDEAEAERLYREAMAAGGDDAEAARDGLVALLIEKGREVGKSDPAAAEAMYREVLELDPDSTNGRLGLARMMLRQNRQSEALALLDERKGCNGCGRLVGVLLVERGYERLKAGEHEAARADFEQALQGMPDPMAALGIVETYLAADAAALAVEAMDKAVPLIRTENTDAQHQFATIRRRAAVAAAQTGDLQLVDRYMAMAPPGAGGDEWFALQIEVSRERVRRGDRDSAIARLANVLDQNAEDMAPSRRGEMQRLLVDLYIGRAAQSLREGDIAKAENDLTYALRIDPDNWTAKLQRVLAVVALGKLDHSFRILKKIPQGTEGRKEVLAILWSLRVNEKLAAGDVEGARRAYENAKQTAPDMPEVHVAAAQLLALTPVDDVSRRDKKELSKRGLMRYPAGHVNRYGEALSELDWARTQSNGLGPRFPYRGPSTETRMKSLEDQIRSFYPFEVKFQAEATSVLVIRARAGSTVEVEGPGGFRQEVSVSGDAPARVTIPEPGLTRLKIGNKRVALITEPYTEITASL
jgi:tetratricopeptide (TPR) repeat protein